MVTQDAIDDLAPKWIVLAGIAGAVPDTEFTLGDVLLANSVHDFSVSALNEDAPPQFRTGGGSMHPAVERLLANLPARRDDLGDWNTASCIGRTKPSVTVPDDIRAECYYGPDKTRETTRNILRRHFAGPEVRIPEFVIGANATSNALIKDTETVQIWKTAARHITRVEMELGGAYLAARRARPNEVPLLSVRGISDVVGFRRSDDWTQFACDAAASFLYALLRALPREAFELGAPESRGFYREVLLARLPRAMRRLVNISVNGIGVLLSRGIGLLIHRPDVTPSVEAIVLAFKKSSTSLLTRTIDPDKRIPRAELPKLEAQFSSDSGHVLCVLGSPGSGKTALLALLATNATSAGIATFAIKADLLPADMPFEDWGCRELGLDISAIDAIKVVASRRRVFVVVDQLDALSSIVGLTSNLFNSVVEFIRECSSLSNVSVVCSCRNFDYSHDARFSELNASVIELSLPAWEDVSNQLAKHGISDSANWSPQFRDILRTPQHLQIYLDRFDQTGRADIVGSYHLMLDELWERNVVSEPERNVLDALTEFLIQSEALWAPAATFERESAAVDALKAKGILEAQGRRIGFKHQTLLEHSKARLFTKADISFSEYILKHQHTLQVRPTVWAVLQYLREASPEKYRVEVETLFAAHLRLHLRFLLIEFLGQIQTPEEFERVLLGDCLLRSEDRMRVLIGIRGNQAWFQAFFTSHFPTVMGGEITYQWPMIGVIGDAWDCSHDQCYELIRKYWFLDPEKDDLTVRALRETNEWGDREVEMACSLIRRSKLLSERLFWAENLVSVVSASRPQKAPRLFVETVSKLTKESAENSDGPQTRWESPLESSRHWYELEGAAEAAPIEFLRDGWNWLVTMCEKFHSGRPSSVLYQYEGYCLSLDEDSPKPESPILLAFLAAIDGTANADPSQFVEATRKSWKSENAVVHRLIIRGLTAVVTAFPDVGLDYLAGDPRRFGVGTHNDPQSDSIGLVAAIAPLLTPGDMRKLEQLILSWTEYRDDQDLDERQITWNREARLRLFNAIPAELLSAEVSQLVTNEKEALPGWDRRLPHSRSGFVRQVPPITKVEMIAATEDHIVDVICKSPTSRSQTREWKEAEGGWEEPGGPGTAGRELAELAKDNPQKVVEIIKKLVAKGSNDAASSAFNGLSESNLSDDEVLSFARSLIDLRPTSEDLRYHIAYLVYRRSKPPLGLPDDICGAISEWLDDAASQGNNGDKPNGLQDREFKDDGTSVLWGHAGELGIVSDSYRFCLLITISAAYLRRNPPAYDKWLAEIETCITGNFPEDTWASFCSHLVNIRFVDGDKVRGVAAIVNLFKKYPSLGQRREGAVLIANIGDLLSVEILGEFLRSLHASTHHVVRQTFGELLTLVAFRDQEHSWARDALNDELTVAETPGRMDEAIVVGIAHAAANLWDEPRARADAARVLCRLIPIATNKIGKAISTVFWAQNDFPVDDSTEQLLQALAANPESLKQIPIAELVPHLTSLAPHKRTLVLSLCQSILIARSTEQELFEAGPALVKISMTLQRFTDTRDGALDLFESLLRLGLDDAFRVLQDIDIRPTARPERPVRQRRRRRR